MFQIIWVFYMLIIIKKIKFYGQKIYKIPFRSNIKITNNKLLYLIKIIIYIFLNKKNGNIIKTIPTEETIN